jgi:hypothetical protein
VGWIARANPTYRSKLISFMPKLCHGMNTAIRVKNGCSMSWREIIEGKIYLYGKELAARATHANSRRTVRAFVAIDCAAFPENLLEAEIFGCEKGASTGAVTASEICLMEMADIRTRFLDEESTDQAPGKADARPLAIGRMK